MATRRKTSAPPSARAVAAEMLRIAAQARQPVHQRERNRARDYYNPLRKLDMARVVRLLEAGERGEHADLQWLYRTVEKRDATLRGLKMRRTSALKKLDWDIKLPDELPAGITPSEANAQQEYLHSTYNGIDNLPQVFEFMALASFRGFSHLEKRWQDNNPALPLTRLVPVPQWHWTRHPQTWAWVYDPTAQGNWSSGTIIDPSDFVIRELDDPVNEIAVVCFLRKNMSQKDWDAFVEDFGIPSVFGILGPNTPATEVAAWLAQVEKVTGNSRGALPPGSDVKTVAHGGQGETPFKQHKDEQREELVLAGTGGLLTMLTAATGLNSEQAKVHEAAFDSIAAAEAAGISADLQTQIDKPLLAREFPGRPQVAYFELASVDREDRGALGELLVKLANAGLESDENEISEKMGLKLRKKPQPATPGLTTGPTIQQAPFANRETAAGIGREALFLARAETLLTEARRVALAPLRVRVEALLSIDDEAAARAATETLRADLPALARQCLSDDATSDLEDAFAAIIGTALASGLAEGAEARAGSDPGAPFANMAPPRHGDTGWDESKYVRDNDGQFSPKGGGASDSKAEGKARERVVRAVHEALRRKGEVHNVMEISGLGQVSIGLGTSGDKDADYRGGWGAAHWQGKHKETTIRAVADLLTKGTVGPATNKKTGQTDPGKREIRHNGWLGILGKQGNRRWRLITVYHDGK
ncbi:MAG: DUF935 domain-containing protein [Opitutaceae bacterium]|nr:DUF935 domain-containing protein [Opitutaceae bacterium]